MDWKAGEHTFFLIADNVGNGCDEWYNWNFLLPDQGMSPWGWSQNALIQVDSKTRAFRYTAEYYAVKHFSHYVTPGSQMVAYSPKGENNMSIVVYRTPEGKYVVIAGNFGDTKQKLSVQLGKKYLNAELVGHSFNTYIVK